MKKKLTALLTAILCMSTPLSANAVDVSIDFSEDSNGIVIRSDDFVYRSNETYGLKSGFFLESALDEPDFMVVGYVYYENCPESPFNYVVSPINQESLLKSGTGILYHHFVQRDLGDNSRLQIGDFVKIDGLIVKPESEPISYLPIEEGSLSCLGNGVELFGEEFKAVIRLQMVIDRTVIDKMKQGNDQIDDIELIQGDINIDDVLNILDCITINKHLLTGTELCDYAKVVGDINQNGALDFGDSLAILKESIGITVNFE